MRRFSVFAALVAGLLLAFLPSATAGNGPKDKVVDVQLLAFNDFHGNLEPPTGSSGRIQIGVDAAGKAVNVDAGGMEYFATWIETLRAQSPHTIVVSAGDNIGASPLLSGLFHDEPTIEALNLIGTKFSAVGNHEFDEGLQELYRMQYGGCSPTDGCQDQTPFYGADFKFLASNVVRTDTGATIFPPYAIRTVAGERIAFIAATLKDTPMIVTPAGVEGLRFDPEVGAVNAVVTELKGEGVHAFVVLLHQGGQQNPPSGGFANVNGCANFSGDAKAVVEGFDPDVDVVVSGHTHNAYVCHIGGKLLTAAASFGRLITAIDLKIDDATGNVVASSARNQIVTRDVAKDPAITDLMNHYLLYEAPIANRIVGSVTAPLTKTQNAAGESPLGDVIADAQLADTAPAAYGGAVVAITNPGGIRTDLAGPGDVTYSQLFAIQPFSNVMNVETLTGAQIYHALEQQWAEANSAAPKVLQVSHGFTYTWDYSQAPGSRIVDGSVAINGVPVTTIGLYRIAMNNFLAGGGDGFTALAGGTDLLGGDVDIDALVNYFGANSPISAPPLDRITRLN